MFRKREGFLVAINQKPRRFTRSPYFHEQFMEEARRQGKSVVFWERARNPSLVFVNDWTVDFARLEAYRKSGIKIVLRIDGAGIKDSRNPRKDNIIYQTSEFCDALIFQSEFCKEIWQRSFGLNKPNYIILNGADQRVFSRYGPKTDFGFKRMIVTAARWRQWKGLDQVIEVFLKLKREDTGLVVMGDDSKVPAHPSIKATGKLAHSEMAKIFRKADLFLYLPWQDWCPKVVAQALVSGLPVVCSYRGGTKELVQDCGIIVHGAKDDDLEDFGPNPVNLDEAVNAVNSLLEKGERCRERQDLYLSTMVTRYFEVFEKVLEQN